MKPIIFSQDVKKVLDMIPVAIVEISFGEGITRDANNANNAFYALTGSTREQYMEEELSGNPRNILHPDDLVPVFEAFKTHAEQKASFDIQYRVIHMDGSTVWLGVHAAYMGTNDGKATFLCTMLTTTLSVRNISSKMMPSAIPKVKSPRFVYIMIAVVMTLVFMSVS